MNEREHARLARELIDACGGLDEAGRACGLSKPVLSNYQQAHHASTMPAKVIACLERYCGKAIYSAALFDLVDARADGGCLRELVCSLTEAAAGLQHRVREAMADERLTPRELDEIARAERLAEEALESFRAARRHAETPTKLKPVA